MGIQKKRTNLALRIKEIGQSKDYFTILALTSQIKGHFVNPPSALLIWALFCVRLFSCCYSLKTLIGIMIRKRHFAFKASFEFTFLAGEFSHTSSLVSLIASLLWTHASRDLFPVLYKDCFSTSLRRTAGISLLLNAIVLQTVFVVDMFTI